LFDWTRFALLASGRDEATLMGKVRIPYNSFESKLNETSSSLQGLELVGVGDEAPPAQAVVRIIHRKNEANSLLIFINLLSGSFDGSL
jgi:hypothetical protein